jgi:hypothetical protein
VSLSDLINQLNSSYTQQQQYINQQHTYNLNYVKSLLRERKEYVKTNS